METQQTFYTSKQNCKKMKLLNHNDGYRYASSLYRWQSCYKIVIWRSRSYPRSSNSYICKCRQINPPGILSLVVDISYNHLLNSHDIQLEADKYSKLQVVEATIHHFPFIWFPWRDRKLLLHLVNYTSKQTRRAVGVMWQEQ